MMEAREFLDYYDEYSIRIAYLIFNYVIGINYWFSCLLAVVIAAILMIGISAYVNKKAESCQMKKYAKNMQ